MKMLNVKRIITSILVVCLNASIVFSDGWINDGYGNWLYEENGSYVKNDTRVIDGVSYYFNHDGYWIPRTPIKTIWLKGKEMVKFTLEGKDYNDRKYKTEVNMAMPIVDGENAEYLNQFIKNEFVNVMKSYFEKYRISILFLIPKMTIEDMLEAQNNNGVICFGYFGGGMINLYLDTKKIKMWALPNTI